MQNALVAFVTNARFFMEPLYTLITIVLSAMGVLIAYLQYKRTSKPVRDNIQLSAEEEVQSIEANGAALPGFVIRFVEPVCYFDCSALEHHGITSSEVLTGTRLVLSGKETHLSHIFHPQSSFSIVLRNHSIYHV